MRRIDEDQTMDDIDAKIVASALRGVDVTEIYSPIRVAETARKYGLVPGTSFDITTGWGFTIEAHRQKAWRQIKQEKPFCIIGSPPCTQFSALMEVNKFTQRDNK